MKANNAKIASLDKKFYITTTLPYVNAQPHIGFALEIVQADTLARLHRLLGEDVVFNFGTDEHGQKIYQKAKESGKDPQEYCDEYAKKFEALKTALNLSYTNFIRTTDPKHIFAAQEFWRLCYKNGYIYKKNYKQKYCVGCELEKSDSELIDGKCPIHPHYQIEIIEEENYFFRFSHFQSKLLEFYNKNPNFVVPKGKFREIKTFVKNGLQDFSISRLKKKMPWGINVPGDENQVMYVWFDALINYISTLGWPDNQKSFQDFWPGVQVAGKDNLRQQTAIWQAMLMAAGLPPSKQIFIHGFITVDGQKISKSLGNAIDPISLAQKYGTDTIRYFLLSKINPFEDSDFTQQRLEDAYNADLANGIGNLISRVAKLCELRKVPIEAPKKMQVDKDIIRHLNNYEFDKAVEVVWAKISNADKYINSNRLWEGTQSSNKIAYVVNLVRDIAYNLKPFLPDTSDRIEKHFLGPTIRSISEPLFPRLG